ncbi:MAG: glycosyltransferase family 4 protein [Sedimentisphaerales bacterium]|nr:glycosyltransferase family 4 protein [Sedimentisphaerales bacterium]
MPKAYPLFNSEVEGVFGGSEVDLYYLATELARDGDFEVSFVVADYGQAERETRENVELIKSVNFNKNSLLGAFKVWQALKRADAQIYMIKTASAGTLLAAGFCKIKGRRFVYRTAHRYECDGTYLRRHRFLGKGFAWSLRQGSAVLAQNGDDAKLLAETTGVKSRVIPNGHRFPGRDAAQERELILWVGRTADFKKPELFIKLAKLFPLEKFVMICQEATGESGYGDLRRAADEVGNLEFLPRVEFHEVGGYFQRAKVLVNTSDSEGFPNTFIQACGCGAAILSLNVNPDDFLGRYDCGRCVGGDWELMVKTLGGMVQGGLAEELGRNGRRYAEENHDITKIVGQYKEIFRKLVAGEHV